ncbi:hypothetical protein llg_38830 [Luteolibacter sp. LG18]|nr:hypothetical protein llg_38830 [Luteolibacter sp. LG18]
MAVAIAKDEPRPLSEAAQQQFQRDKVVITPKTYRQVFSAYEPENSPFFITTDCVIAGWHSLLQQSLRQMEEGFAARMPSALDRVLESLPRKAPEGMTKPQYVAGLERAKIVLGVASRLAGGKWRAEGELGKRIEAEAKRVEKAEGVYMPAWLKDDLTGAVGLDYAVFKPAGFHAEQESLRRYFRALRWLQTVPFAVKRDESVAAMALMVPGFQKAPEFEKMSEVFQALVGSSGKDAMDLVSEIVDPMEFDLENYRRILASPTETDPKRVIFGAACTIDVRLFRSETDPESRPFPESLEMAAFLGSPLGVRRFPEEASEVRRSESAEDLHTRYLECLRDLTAAPDPMAPAFMKSDVWVAKSTNTQLAGWVKLCHDFVLQRQEAAITLGISSSHPNGFVEPNPKFYRHVGRLAADAGKVFERAGSLAPQQDVQARAREAVALCRELSKMRENQEESGPDGNLSPELKEKSMQGFSMLVDFWPVLKAEGVDISDTDSYVGVLEKIAAGKDLEGVSELLQGNHLPTLLARWLDLIVLCGDLGDISQKELRGIELDARDEEVIAKFGERLGSIMSYDAEGWKFPRDDAPEVAPVFNQPGQGMLMGAVGRPREIRVLYPWKNEEIECTGAILPFHEFRSDRHLTDGEWKVMLDGANPPASPDWMQPLMVK